jgi:hypothetical protein
MSYRKRNNNFDLDFRKSLAILATLFLFFVLPISVINQNIPQNAPAIEEDEGRVAGVTTDVIESNQNNEVNAETLFLTLGILFFGISIILATYFLIQSFQIRKFKP